MMSVQARKTAGFYHRIHLCRCISWVVIVEGEGAVLRVNFGRPIVTKGDGYALFPNNFGEYLFTSMIQTYSQGRIMFFRSPMPKYIAVEAGITCSPVYLWSVVSSPVDPTRGVVVV